MEFQDTIQKTNSFWIINSRTDLKVTRNWSTELQRQNCYNNILTAFEQILVPVSEWENVVCEKCISLVGKLMEYHALSG